MSVVFGKNSILKKQLLYFILFVWKKYIFVVKQIDRQIKNRKMDHTLRFYQTYIELANKDKLACGYCIRTGVLW